MIKFTDTRFFNLDTSNDSECKHLRSMGCSWVILFALSLLGNLFALYKLYFSHRSHVETLGRYNYFSYQFFVKITLLNIVYTLLELSMTFISDFYCQWSFGNLGCDLSTNIQFFMCCATIYITCAVLYERNRVTEDPLSEVKRLSGSFYHLIYSIGILVCIFLSPKSLMSWSVKKFTFLPDLSTVDSHECLSWNLKPQIVTGFNLPVYVCIFIIPALFILATTIQLVYHLLSNQNYSQLSQLSSIDRFVWTNERKISKLVLVWLGVTAISYLPYIFYSLEVSFSDKEEFDHHIGYLALFISRSSLVWSPTIFSIGHCLLDKMSFTLMTDLDLEWMEHYISTNNRKEQGGVVTDDLSSIDEEDEV